MQVRQAGEAIDKLVSEPFAEITLVPIRTHIHERQDCNGSDTHFRNYPGPPLAILLLFGADVDALDLLNVDRLRCRRLNVCDEAVAAPGDGLDITGAPGVVAQRLPQLHDAVG